MALGRSCLVLVHVADDVVGLGCLGDLAHVLACGGGAPTPMHTRPWSRRPGLAWPGSSSSSRRPHPPPAQPQAGRAKAHARGPHCRPTRRNERASAAPTAMRATHGAQWPRTHRSRTPRSGASPTSCACPAGNGSCSRRSSRRRCCLCRCSAARAAQVSGVKLVCVCTDRQGGSARARTHHGRRKSS